MKLIPNPIHLSSLLLPFLSPSFLALLLTNTRVVPGSRRATAIEASEGALQGGGSSAWCVSNAGCPAALASEAMAGTAHGGKRRWLKQIRSQEEGMSKWALGLGSKGYLT